MGNEEEIHYNIGIKIIFGGSKYIMKRIVYKKLATNTGMMIATGVILPIIFILAGLPESNEFVSKITPWFINFKANIILTGVTLVVVLHVFYQLYLIAEENENLRTSGNDVDFNLVTDRLISIETMIKSSEDDEMKDKMRKLVDQDQFTNAAAIYTYSVHQGHSEERDKVIKVKYRAGSIREDYDFNYIGQDRYSIPKQDYIDNSNAIKKAAKFNDKLNKFESKLHHNRNMVSEKRELINEVTDFINREVKNIRSYELQLRRTVEHDISCSTCIMNGGYKERDAIIYALMVARINAVEFLVYQVAVYSEDIVDISDELQGYIHKYKKLYSIKRIGFLIAILMKNGSFTKEHTGLSSKAGRVYYFENLNLSENNENLILALAMTDKNELTFINDGDHAAKAIENYYEKVLANVFEVVA